MTLVNICSFLQNMEHDDSSNSVEIPMMKMDNGGLCPEYRHTDGNT